MKKILIAILSVLILAGGGVGLYFGVIKDNTPDLTITANNTTLTIGTTTELEYKCSIDDALITFEVEDESIATISYIDSIATIVAHDVGSTRVVVKVYYKSFKNSCSAMINVVAESSQGGEDPVAYELTFENLQNITLTEKTFTMNVGANAMFTIMSNFNIQQINSVEFDSSNVAAERIEMIANTFRLSCLIAGSYKMTIVINTSITFEYNINVE